jgi:hypothetical protein
MFREYAVEPRAVGSSWQTCRYVVEKFGFDKGRLISEFPKAWLREVYDSTSGMPDLEKKRLVELLVSAKKRLVKSGRPYDPNAGDWLFNAVTEHARLPFDGIIARENPGKVPDVLVVDELDEHSASMVVATSAAVPRDSVAISKALSMLLTHGSRIAFVDPFFDLFNQRYKDTLRDCLIVASARNATAICEIHYRYHDNKVTPSDIEKNAVAAFKGLIPNGMTVRVFCWRQKDGGEDFHARYLLTDRGGMVVDAGFSAEGDHETTDMHVLGIDLCSHRLAAFTPPADVYQLVGPILSVDANCQVTHVK